MNNDDVNLVRLFLLQVDDVDIPLTKSRWVTIVINIDSKTNFRRQIIGNKPGEVSYGDSLDKGQQFQYIESEAVRYHYWR